MVRRKDSRVGSWLTAGLLAGVSTLVGFSLASNGAKAESATAGVTVGSACTMTAIIDTAHTAEVPASSSKEDIGSTELKTICNDNGGFAVYAVGCSNDEFGNNKMIGANSEFNTGTATSGANSNWSMKLSQVTTGTYATTIDGTFGAYSGVPATFTKVAHRDANTDDPEASSATGSSIALTYGAYIASTQAPGDYTGKVKFTLVHPSTETPVQPQPSTAGYISFFANASNAEGTMGSQSATDNTSVTLLASNFSRTGYGFAGWSDAYDYATNPSAHFYGPMETITAPEGTTANGLSLYAVWVKSQGSIQDQSKVASVCSSLTTAPTDGTANLSSVSALTDQRDNNTYAIAKLADGKCWMIENLRLESTADHNSDGSLAQGYGTSATYGNFSGLADAESTYFFNSTKANSLYYSGTQSGDATINIGTSDYPTYRMPRYNNLNTPANANDRPQNPTSNTFTNNNTTVGMYSYGNYYTWHAAIADLTYNSTDNQSTTGTSLCPTGWHLPKGGDKSNESNNEFWSLVVGGINGNTKPANYDSSTRPYYTGTPEGTDASNKLRAYPNNFLYSGYFNESSANGRGSYGSCSTSTAIDNFRSYYLYLYSSSVYPGTGRSDKNYGQSIRCTVGT